MDWKKFKKRVTPEAFAKIEEFGKGFDECAKRIAVARRTLKKKGLTAIDREEAEDELRCALDDSGFMDRRLREAIVQSGVIGTDDDWEPDSEQFRSQPHEVARKAKFEAAAGRELSWPEYWKLLDGLYADEEEAAEMVHATKVRSYGWDFDAGNAEAHFSSDDGNPMHGDQERKLASREEGIRISADSKLEVRRSGKKEVRGG